MIKNIDTYVVLYGEFEKEKEKNKSFFDLPEQGFEPQIFSNFPAHGVHAWLCDKGYRYLVK